MPFDPNDESLDFFQYLGSSESEALPQAEDDPAGSLEESSRLPDLFADIAADAASASEKDSLSDSLNVAEQPSGASFDVLESSDDLIKSADTDFTSDPEALPESTKADTSYSPPAAIDIGNPAEDFVFPEAAKAPESSRSQNETRKRSSNLSDDRNTRKKVAVRKIRPRRKKGEGFFGIPNIIVTGVWCALILLTGLTLGRMMWLCAAEVLAFGKNDVTVTVTINETDTIDDIATKLAREGLIQYRSLFKLYASFAVDEGDIKPGVWELNTKYDYHALVNGMAPSSKRSVVKVTIPEGYTCRQIFSLLEEKKVCSAQELSSYAATGELDNYWFLSSISRGDAYCLEGYLFPDTYEFYTNDSPKSVLSKMLNNFDSKFDESMRWQISQLNDTLTSMMRRNGKSEAFITENQFTAREVVIVASMIEKETSSSEEGYMIASVIYNRLFNWGTNPAYLNIDATIVYATGGDNENIAANLQIDSPYNTYRYTGLTPGAISNPGLASLKAALTPNNSNYYYYVLDPDPNVNHHIFATTQAEHDANVAAVNKRN